MLVPLNAACCPSFAKIFKENARGSRRLGRVYDSEVAFAAVRKGGAYRSDGVDLCTGKQLHRLAPGHDRPN